MLTHDAPADGRLFRHFGSMVRDPRAIGQSEDSGPLARIRRVVKGLLRGTEVPNTSSFLGLSHPPRGDLRSREYDVHVCVRGRGSTSNVMSYGDVGVSYAENLSNLVRAGREKARRPISHGRLIGKRSLKFR